MMSLLTLMAPTCAILITVSNQITSAREIVIATPSSIAWVNQDAQLIRNQEMCLNALVLTPALRNVLVKSPGSSTCSRTLTAHKMRLLTLEAPTSARSIASALETVLAPSLVGAREPPAAPPPCPLPASSMRARTLWAPTDAPLTLTAKALALAPPTIGARDRRDAKLSSP